MELFRMPEIDFSFLVDISAK